MRKMVFGVFSLLMVFGLPALAQEAEQTFSKPHISVEGEATQDVTPDMAILTLGFSSENPVSADAVSENAKLTNAALAEVKAAGVPAKDIQTRNVALQTSFEEQKDSSSGQIKNVPSGYRASSQLVVTIRDVSKVGALVSGVVANGANSYYGLNFIISNRSKYEDDLRAKAVGEVKKKAELYAQGAGMKLGRLLALVPLPQPDIPNLRTPPIPFGSKIVSMQLEPGIETVSVKVSGTWELVTK